MTTSHPVRDIDEALTLLPREIEPTGDLWAGVEARLEARPHRRAGAWAWQVAAGLVLVALSSIITAGLVRRPGVPVATVARPVDATVVVPAAFGPARVLDPAYEKARRQLAADLEQRLAGMPRSAREKLEANLAEMRRAAEEINVALSRQPGDPLLEELLLNTYQDELGVLASVNQLTSTGAATVPARQEKMRL
jgi:hypothetical protein